jgi:hypothetical protein
MNYPVSSSSVCSRALAPLFALLLAFPLSAHAVADLGTAARSMPYDPHMTSVRRVFGNIHHEDPTLDRVNALMRRGRSFRYTRHDLSAPAPPEKTSARHAGDCKDKAVWLKDQLRDQDVRYVTGKFHRTSRIGHAWLVWRHGGQWWILDCTMHDHAIPADRVGANQYIPHDSLARNSVYRR